MKLRNIKNILFDCDGVLYQDLEAVFGQVSKKMTEYISKKLNSVSYTHLTLPTKA